MSLIKNSSFSDRLAIALSQNDLTVTDLAKQVGMSKQAISTYATGVRSPKLPAARLIAEILNVDDMWLMGYDVPMKANEPTAQKDSELIMNVFKQLNDENRKIETGYYRVTTAFPYPFQSDH